MPKKEAIRVSSRVSHNPSRCWGQVPESLQVRHSVGTAEYHPGKHGHGTSPQFVASALHKPDPRGMEKTQALDRAHFGQTVY
jgi:hypothetical protein